MNIKTIIKRSIGIAVLANVIPFFIKLILNAGSFPKMTWGKTYMIYGIVIAVAAGLIIGSFLLTRFFIWCFDIK